VIDNIADDVNLIAEEKRRRLAKWRGWLRSATPDEPSLALDLRSLIDKYSLSPGMLE